MKREPVVLMALAAVLLSVFSMNVWGRSFTIGVEEIEYYPHYDFNHQPNSFAKETLDLFAKKHGYVFTYEPLPIKRLFYRFVHQQLDFKYPDHPGWQPELKKDYQVIYSEPVEEIVGGTLVLPKNKGRGLDRFKSLGVVLGFTPFHWYPIIEQQKIRLFESNDVRIVLKQVLLERVDGADMELSVAAYQLNRLQQTGKLVFDPALPFIVAPFYFSTIKHPAVIEQFNRFLHSEKPEIDRIKERHGILDAESVLNHAQ